MCKVQAPSVEVLIRLVKLLGGLLDSLAFEGREDTCITSQIAGLDLFIEQNEGYG